MTVGQTSELDEEKLSVFMLPDATAKDVDDISRAMCVGGEDRRRTVTTTVRSQTYYWAEFF